MSGLGQRARALLGEGPEGRLLPPSPFTVRLAQLSAAAIGMLAVFAMALTLSAGRLAKRWEASLAETATVRVTAPAEEIDARTEAALAVLSGTPGVTKARRLEPEELRALLAPWLGPDLPVDALPVPALIEVEEAGEGFDAEGLRLRLAAEVPGAVLDDHTRWRRPLVRAASGLRYLGIFATLLTLAGLAGVIALAAQATLARDRGAIELLRLVGAEDSFVARAVVRRFAQAALLGTAAGVALGVVAVALVPSAAESGVLLGGLGIRGAGWLWPLVLPPLAALVAGLVAGAMALRAVRGLP